MSITLYNVKGSPLTPQEMDTNFDSLLPKDGSNPIEGDITVQGILTIQGLNIAIDNASDTLTIGGPSDTVEIPGTLETSISQSPTVEGKTFTVDSDSSTKLESNGAGLKVGTNTVNLLYNNTTDAWEATTNISGEGVNMKANDFLTDAGGSLSDTISDVSNLEMFTGSMGASSTDYTTTNYLASESTLSEALIKIDTELKNISDSLGNVQNASANYTEENTVTSGESLEKGIDDLDIHSKFTITKFEKSSSSIEAISGTEYMISPSAQETLDVTLPSAKKGIVGVRMMVGGSGEAIRVTGDTGDSIEEQGTDQALITQDNQTIYFIWDTTYNTWRIR